MGAPFPQPGYDLLFLPRVRAIVNSYRRGGRLKYYFFGGLTFCFWIGLFVGAMLLFGRLAAEQPFGPLLVHKLLGFLFMLFFAVLVFSNIVTSFSNLFLADDLYLFVCAPLQVDRLYLSRAIQAGLQSGWMVMLFAAPLWLAAGVVFDSPMWFYPWMALIMGIFLLLPSALGALITTLLVKAFPARKAQDVMIIVSIALVVVFYFLVRFLRPEQLFNPDLFHGFAEYFATLREPNSPLIPSVWATEALWAGLTGKLDQNALLLTAYGLAAGVGSLAVAAWIAEFWYADAFSKSQEGRRAPLTTSAGAGRLFQALTFGAQPLRRMIMIKDLKAFFRETTQWTQLLLLMALIVVYLFNFRVLPLERFGLSFYQRSLIAYVNMVLAGFVLSAVSVRFVLPAVSVEGRAFWILRAAPIRMRDVVLAKYVMNLLPIALIGQALVVISNNFLHTHPALTVFSSVLMLLISISITAMAVGIGALMPSFGERNVARMATGAGSIVYMVAAMALIIMQVALAYAPGKEILFAMLSHQPLGLRQSLFVAATATVGLGTFALATVLPLRMGIQALETRPA